MEIDWSDGELLLGLGLNRLMSSSRSLICRFVSEVQVQVLALPLPLPLPLHRHSSFIIHHSSSFARSLVPSLSSSTHPTI